MELLKAIFGGAIGAAIVTGVFSVILWKLNRKAKKEDDADDKYSDLKNEIADMKVGMKVFFYDRIKFLSTSHIANGEIDEADREGLQEMHQIYHKFGGNGYLDDRMEKVKGLPGKTRKKG